MRTRGTMAVVAAVAVLVAGCSDDGGSDAAEAVTTTTAAVAETDAPSAAVDGTTILETVGTQVALVETPIGSGTAVLLDDGHLVTNAHVVDPYAEVDVTFADTDPQSVEVVGVDLAADIAVLGPVDGAGEGVAIEDSEAIEPGSDVYLVGFPGDTLDVEVTISRGVLSRRRTAEAWGLHFLQTDAAISGGQSGGAVVDDTGRVVGISGLSYDDQFALALAGEDVRTAVAAILDGGGSEWTPLPPASEATDRSAEVTLDSGLGLDSLYLPEGAADGTLTISADAGASVAVTDLTLYALAVNEAAADGYDPEDPDVPEPTTAVDPGTWTFDVPTGEPLLVIIDSADVEATSMGVSSSDPFAVVSPYDEPLDVAVGDEVEGVVSSLGESDAYFLDLEEGQEVTITVTSASGDMAFSTYADDDPEEGTETDDGGGGLLELDAESTLTADAAGPYVIEVYQVDGYANAYRLTVTEG